MSTICDTMPSFHVLLDLLHTHTTLTEDSNLGLPRSCGPWRLVYLGHVGVGWAVCVLGASQEGAVASVVVGVAGHESAVQQRQRRRIDSRQHARRSAPC